VSELHDIHLEAQEALDTVWFLRSLEEVERTDSTLSLRLHIRSSLFVQIFYGERSNVLYMALVEGGRRTYGIDRDRHGWHRHPYGDVEKHESLPGGPIPKPIFTFLAQVEDLLLDKEMI
jgi:hypothetical protein